jgi:hypothetical protein
MTFLMRTYAIFFCYFIVPSFIEAFTPAEQNLYLRLIEGIKPADFSEEAFKAALLESNKLEYFKKLSDAYQKTLNTPVSQSEMEKDPTDSPKKSLIQYSIFLLDPTEEKSFKKRYTELSLIIHPDKTDAAVQNLLAKAALNTESAKKIIANATAIGDNLFKTYSAAQNILKAAENTPEYSTAMLPENRAAYAEDMRFSPAEKKLRRILSPDFYPLLSQSTFEKNLQEKIEELQKLFKEPASNAALTLLLKNISSKELDTESLYQEIIPEIKKRIAFYTVNRREGGNTALEKSFEKKNIETVFDIVAYSAYLEKNNDGKIPSEIEQLGEIIDNQYTSLLMEFYGAAALKGERISNDSMKFYSHYSVFGWATLSAIHERTFDGISWGLTIQNPERIADKLTRKHEAATAIRRANELIQKLTTYAESHPDLREVALKKIDAILKQIPKENTPPLSPRGLIPSLNDLSMSLFLLNDSIKKT